MTSRRQSLQAMLALAGLPLTGASHAEPAMRDMTSLQLSQRMGTGWNLGNSLEATGGETAWGNPPATQALLDAVKAAGFRTVRIPVAWKQYANADDEISARWMSRVAEVVGYAQRAGLFAMINLHWDGGWMQPTRARQAEANRRITRFWTQIGRRFQDHDDTLLFAGTNEVMVEGDYSPPKPEYVAVQNGFNQTFVDAVRATGGNNATRHLIVQGFNTNIDHTIAHAVMPRDTVRDRLMMEVHYYDPYEFTLDEKSAIWQWGAAARDAKATAPWGDAAHADAQFRKMKARFIDRGIPVILGEFGAIRREDRPGAEAYRIAWNRHIARSARAHGLVPVYWDNGVTGQHGMGLFDRRTGAQVYPELIQALLGTAT
ncbi:glycoside hydrolase family 5 protein [Roseateles puraquae]|uniref:Endoglucanase n=1 Tax=Roseateles puraquae TaxID=431059 RepID=A0A254N8R8_9BURK|nr:glycoside hydrolase family 5 protein [Roseateles puraquae]MDG0855136.1 glycoside hydrolase family 5 protein [Roseateles puraquae]OWR02757.1 endoglucanase [Roseateles puraquae]